MHLNDSIAYSTVLLNEWNTINLAAEVNYGRQFLIWQASIHLCADSTVALISNSLPFKERLAVILRNPYLKYLVHYFLISH